MKKIFQIGFNKCGTSSLTKFFDSAEGLNAIHWDNGKLAERFFYRMGREEDPFLDYPKVNGFFDMVKVSYDEILEPYKYVEYIYRFYPDSYFILNVRNVRDWVDSRRKHRGGSLTDRYREVLNLSSDSEVFDYWTNEFFLHHGKVVDFFINKNASFLVYDIDRDDPSVLKDFVSDSYNVPLSSWGRYNVTKL